MQCADHSEGERLVESERIADREGKLTDLEVGRAANSDRLRNHPGIAQTDDGEVIVRGRADDVRCNGLTSGKPDRHVGRTVDHMVVGDDIAGAGLYARTFVIGYI